MSKDKKYKNENWLKNKHLNELLTAKEISNICNCSTKTIWYWLKKFDIKKSNPSLTKENSLKLNHSDLLREWSGKNDKDPSHYTSNSAKKVWWQCSDCNREWRTQVRIRTQQESGCPYCSGNRVSGTNNIKKQDLYDEYHEENEKSLKEYSKGSNKSVKWRCQKCNWEWYTSIYNRTHNVSGCPRCAGNTVHDENRLSTNYPKITKELISDNLNPEETSYGSKKRGRWECSECSHIWETQIFNRTIHNSGCPECCTTWGPSKAESEIEEYLKDELGVENITRNNRNVIAPKELDIYLPDHNLAIEYNGLHWHSVQYKDKKYHREKTDACNEKDINLIHVFSDDWRDRKDIIKSMIAHAVGRSPNVVYARKCDIVLFNKNKQFAEFFEENHIQGQTMSSWAYGLKYNDELVACLSMRTPIHHDDAREIARFAVKKFHHIPGAFSKLFKRAKEKTLHEERSVIISYADLSYGDGGVYEENGFTLNGDTKLNYWYTDGKERYNRFKFRAQDGMSEREYARENGVEKLYGCGNKLYKMELK